MSNSYFTSTGAELRALAAKGDALAIAEQARRAAKGSTTVAALRSQGKVAEADAKVAAAKAAAAKAAKPRAAPQALVAFARQVEVLPALAAAPKTIKALHERTEARFERIETVLVAMAKQMGVAVK